MVSILTGPIIIQFGRFGLGQMQYAQLYAIAVYATSTGHRFLMHLSNYVGMFPCYVSMLIKNQAHIASNKHMAAKVIRSYVC